MNFAAFLSWCSCVALLTIRLLIAVALSPALSAFSVPATVRVALVLVLAVMTFAYRSPLPTAAAWVADPTLLLTPALAEIFNGALLGLGLHVVMAACALAGRLLDVQIGFGIGSVFDPVTRASSNVLGSLVGLLGITLFFVSDAHLGLVQLIARSIDVFPLGELPALDEPMRLLQATGAMFTLGVALAAPVAVALLLTDLAVGVASRNMPQINVLILAAPVKILVGYLVLAVAVSGWGPLLERGLGDMSDALELR